MSIFKKIGRFFKKPEVKHAIKETAKVVASGTTTGRVINLAMDLGAFDWLAGMIGKSIKKVSNFDDEISVKLLQFAAKAVIETEEASVGGKLTTGDHKRSYALERFKFYMINDEDVVKHPHVITVAPVIIQYVYEAGKLKLLLDEKNRKEVGSLMMNIGSRAILDQSVDPVKEFFDALNLVQENQDKQS